MDKKVEFINKLLKTVSKEVEKIDPVFKLEAKANLTQSNLIHQKIYHQCQIKG